MNSSLGRSVSSSLPVSVTPPGSGMAGFELKGVMAEDDTVFLRYEARSAQGSER